MIGQLLCRACTSPDQFISLGRVSETTEVRGGVTINIDGYEPKVPTALRDVVGREHGLYLLSCGHRHPGMPMYSNQEHLTLEDGTVIHGHSAIGECR